jgi:hypothetical protein
MPRTLLRDNQWQRVELLLASKAKDARRSKVAGQSRYVTQLIDFKSVLI